MEPERYFFALEKKGIIKPYFIFKLTDNFVKDNQKRPRILKFLENCHYRLSCSEEEMGSLDIVKLDRTYYNVDAQSYGGTLIGIVLFEKIDIDYCNSLAIENIVDIVDEELSSGDRKIIRDIALQSFQKKLEISSNKKSLKKGNLAMCVRTDMHLDAINQLLSYGFKLNLPKEERYFIILE